MTNLTDKTYFDGMVDAYRMALPLAFDRTTTGHIATELYDCAAGVARSKKVSDETEEQIMMALDALMVVLRERYKWMDFDDMAAVIQIYASGSGVYTGMREAMFPGTIDTAADRIREYLEDKLRQ